MIWVRILQGAETLCSPLAILRGTEPVSVIGVLYNGLYKFPLSQISPMAILP